MTETRSKSIDGVRRFPLKGKRIGLRARLRALLEDRHGVGGVEFALIAPMLLVLYLSAVELTVGLSIAKKTSLAASTITDLVARTEDRLVKTDLLAMEDLAKSIFVPYPSRELSIKVTGITVDAAGDSTVAWSWANKGGAPYVVGSAVNVPEGMEIPRTFLVRTELSVKHDLMMYLPSFTGSNLKQITIARDFFFRQRVGSGIECGNC